MRVLKLILVAALVGCSGWYYMHRSKTMHTISLAQQNETQQAKQVVESKKVFGFAVDDFVVEKGRIKRNQYLAEILSEHNVDHQRIGELAKKSKNVFDVRKIRSNTAFTLVCKPDSLHSVVALFYEPNPIDYVAYYLDDSVRVEMHQRPVSVIEKTAAGTIQSSLAETMAGLNLSPQLTNDFADVFAWQVDFFRLFPGDQFKVIYEEKFVEDNSVGLGEILGATFTHDGKDFFAFYFDQGSGVDYFDEEGNSLRKALLKYPLEFTRISSRYTGRRFHPVQKVYKAHRGTDFAARTGTPIRSVGDGVIVEARYSKYNGNYVKVKHNGIYSTQYLHMSKIKSGIRPGVRVSRGQTIGFVGSTGLARGSHLCYRFWKNGVQVDALKVDIPPSEPIAEENIASYENVKQSILARLNQIEVPSSEVLAGGF